MSNTTQRELEEQVRDIADTAKERLTAEYAHEIVADVEFRVNYQGEILGVMLHVAYGGPSIWVNTYSNKVEGWWWGCYAECMLPYGDWDAIQDYWTESVEFKVA